MTLRFVAAWGPRVKLCKDSACMDALGDTQSIASESASEDASDVGVAGRLGELADKYRVEGVIGVGGMGVVVRAEHRHLERPVAIKLLQGVRGEEARLRFLREAKLAASLDSPHIARVLDYGVLKDATAYLVMDLLEGCSLRERLLDTPLSFDETLRLSQQLARGLAAIHAQGVVHRDLKPSNVFLTKDWDSSGSAKIIDFGVAKRVAGLDGDAGQDLTREGQIVGTVRYMSPEQIRHSNDLDGRADVWSLGVIMYELLSGEPAFAKANQADVLAAILTSGEPLNPCRVRPGVPEPFGAIVERCLQRDRGDRFASAAELQQALSVMDPPSISSMALPTVAPERRRGWFVAGVAVVVIGAVATVIAARPTSPPELVSGIAGAANPLARKLVASMPRTPGPDATASAATPAKPKAPTSKRRPTGASRGAASAVRKARRAGGAAKAGEDPRFGERY